MGCWQDYIEAVDGTQITARVTGLDTPTYFGRKYCHTQNIMACDFDMCFIFVSLGLERSMHDSRIFNEIITNDNVPFPHPEEVSVVECTFSAWKNRWGSIQNMHQYDFANVQVQLIGTSMALHNYIRSNTGNQTTVNPIFNEEEAMAIVNGTPEVAHDKDGLMVGMRTPMWHCCKFAYETS
ncbi:unnamed protein product [Camellia sinensis]